LQRNHSGVQNGAGFLNSATLSSSAAPYHYFYDGDGGFYRNNGNCNGNFGGGARGVQPNRGTKSDVGVPIHHRSAYQQPSGVHKSQKPSVKMDYLENYKTGVDRLNFMNKLNNNNTGHCATNEPNEPANTKQTAATANYGPLVYLDRNQNGQSCRYENNVSKILYLI
jgi:hypothetical protein